VEIGGAVEFRWSDRFIFWRKTMQVLIDIEQNNLEYADIIEELISVPRTNEQLVSLCESVVRYLRQSGQELQEYNKVIEDFKGLLYRLP